MLGKYYVLPILLYVSLLLLCLVTNHSSWLSDEAFILYIPGLIVIATIIVMWISHNDLFSQWNLNFYKEYYAENDIPWRYQGAMHTLNSLLLMVVLGGSMYGMYYLVLEKIMSVQHIKKIETQTQIPDELRIVVDDLMLNATLRAVSFEANMPKSKNEDKYKIITAYIYRCIENRPNVWLMLSDSMHIENSMLQNDSVTSERLGALFMKAMSYEPQHSQCYQVNRLDDSTLIAEMQRNYEKEYGESTFQKGVPVYALSAVNSNRMQTIFPWGVLLLTPFFLLFLLVIYRLSLGEKK